MKQPNYLCLLLTISAVGLFLSGCVIKPARVSTRHFVLAPISRSEHAPANTANTQPLAVEVTSVKMPAYLLRDSLLVRKGAQEVAYLETALWAERLDRLFRETLEQNLAVVLAPADVASEPVRVEVRLSVNVEQFDVDTDGRGTLHAEWRLTPTGADKPMKMGQARLTRSGSPPRANPQAIATTLSALLAEFSQELAPKIRQSAQITE